MTMEGKASRLGPVYLTMAAALWGGMFVVSAATLRVVPAWLLLEWRLLLGTPFLLIGVWRRPPRRALTGRDLALFAVLGAVGFTGSVGLQFVGTSLAGAAVASLVTAASPGLIALLAVPLLRQHLRREHLLAFALGIVGIVAVVGRAGGTASAAGDLALVGATVLWAVYTVLGRWVGQRWGALTTTAAAALFGCLWTLPLALAQGSSFVPKTFSLGLVLALLYLGPVATAGGFYAWNRGFELVPARLGGLFLLLQPLVGGLLGHVFLGEALGVRFWAGTALIGLAVWAATRAETRDTATRLDAEAKEDTSTES
jgi:drug/metabolite transporter (DMT)-like permease